MLTQTPSLYDLLDFVSDTKGKSTEEVVQTLLVCFEQKDAIRRVSGDEQCFPRIRDWVAREIIYPHTKQLGTYHLANVLELIRIFCVDWNMDLKNHPDTLMSIIGFTNISDPWTSTLAYSKANILLSLCGLNSESEMRSQFIINACLTGFLRVLSSSTAPKPLELGKVSHVNYGKLKTISGAHWRDTHPHACSVLSWAMTNSEPILLRRHWHLFMPPLLTLLEDAELSIRSRALTLARTFMVRCGPQLLCSAGLIRILEDAIFPSLAYLPTLTPKDESVNILEPAYDALIMLSSLAHQGSADPTIRDHLLERILREGILVGYSHAYGSPRIIESLMIQCARIVHALGIQACKHLGHLLLMYSEVMADSAITNHGESSLAVVDALGETIMMTWPRLQTGNHVPDIVRMTVMFWLNTCGVETHIAITIRSKLQRVWRLLSAALLNVPTSKASMTLDDHAQALMEKEPDLNSLFHRTQ